MKKRQLIFATMLAMTLFTFFSCGPKEQKPEQTTEAKPEVPEFQTAELHRVTFNYPKNWTLKRDQNEGKFRYDTQELYKNDNVLNYITLYVTNANGRLIKANDFAKNIIGKEEHEIIKEFDTFGKYTGKGLLVKQKRNGYDMENLYFSAINKDTVVFQVLIMQPVKGRDEAGIKMFEESLNIEQ